MSDKMKEAIEASAEFNTPLVGTDYIDALFRAGYSPSKAAMVMDTMFSYWLVVCAQNFNIDVKNNAERMRQSAVDAAKKFLEFERQNPGSRH